ncbi:MAG: hypothetical protein AAF092_13940 [Pseudomonadota bacterium]
MSVECGRRPVEVSVLRIEPGPRAREHRAYVRLLISEDQDASLTTALTTVVPVVGADLYDDNAMAERIVAGACTWFEAYVDGKRVEGDDANLFAADHADHPVTRKATPTAPARRAAVSQAPVAGRKPRATPLRLTPEQRVSCLSPQAERELAQELREIEAEFAGVRPAPERRGWAVAPY